MKTYVHTKIYKNLFIAALFIITKVHKRWEGTVIRTKAQKDIAVRESYSLEWQQSKPSVHKWKTKRGIFKQWNIIWL